MRSLCGKQTTYRKPSRCCLLCKPELLSHRETHRTECEKEPEEDQAMNNQRVERDDGREGRQCEECDKCQQGVKKEANEVNGYVMSTYISSTYEHMQEGEVQEEKVQEGEMQEREVQEGEVQERDQCQVLVKEEVTEDQVNEFVMSTYEHVQEGEVQQWEVQQQSTLPSWAPNVYVDANPEYPFYKTIAIRRKHQSEINPKRRQHKDQYISIYLEKNGPWTIGDHIQRVRFKLPSTHGSEETLLVTLNALYDYTTTGKA